MNIVDNPSEFFKGLNEKERYILLNWCKQFDEIQTINKRHSSYGLKHIFERSENGFYITNGMFKGAMEELNFKILKTNKNWNFNISEKSVKELKKNNENDNKVFKVEDK